MKYGEAYEEMKNGKLVAREGWNGKNMFLYYVPSSKFIVNREPLLSIFGEGYEMEYHSHVDMKTAQGYCVPWLASQVDLAADDWVIVENK